MHAPLGFLYVQEETNMSSFNSVCLAGRLTNDVNLRHTPNGKAVASFDIAINSTHKDKAGNKVEETVFVPVTVWAKQAETCEKYLKKGNPVLIGGRIRQERWEAKDGGKRSRLVVVAQIVRFLEYKAKENSSSKPIESPEQDSPGLNDYSPEEQ